MKKKLVLSVLLVACFALHGAVPDKWAKQHVQQLCNLLAVEFGRTLVKVQPIVKELRSLTTLENVLEHDINCLEGVERAYKELQDPEIVDARTEFEKFVGKIEMIEECGQCIDEYGQRRASLFRYHLSMLLCGLPVDDGVEYKAHLGTKILAEDLGLAEAVAALQVAQNEERREQEEARNAAQIEEASTQFLDDVKRSPTDGGEEFYG